MNFYIEVRNQELAEYCKCGLSDLGAEPHLVVAGLDARQEKASCVWSFDKLAADKAPQATTTLLCIE